MNSDFSDARRAAAVRKQLRRLSAAKRCVLELVYFHGLTNNEIAEKTGVAPQVVKKQIRAGLVALRKAAEDG